MNKQLPAATIQVHVEGQYIGQYTLPASFDQATYWHRFLHIHFFCPECAKVWCRHITDQDRQPHRQHQVALIHCPPHAIGHPNDRCSLIPDPSREKLYLDNFDLSLLKYEFLLRTQEMSHEQNT